jgi:hypothetical protein
MSNSKEEGYLVAKQSKRKARLSFILISNGELAWSHKTRFYSDPQREGG